MANHKRILIVDDDQHIRRGAHFRLKSAGYDTLEATNGRNGVDAANEFHPDAIIMDVRMPIMDGVSATQHLKDSAETRNIPVVVVSASPRDESAALNSGARYFIRKPYAVDALIAALDSAMSDTTDQVTSGRVEKTLSPV